MANSHDHTPVETAASAPAVVLVEPQMGENVGSAARAMANFGLADLRLVSPREAWPNPRAVATAASAGHVLEAARVFDTLEAAIADCHYVCATTARPRDMVKPVLSPQSAAGEMETRVGQGERCAMLFGRESSGLSNDHIALADAAVMAPVDPAFASLNLAQAVLLMGYEWMKRSGGTELGRRTAFDGPAREGLETGHTVPATRTELTGFFGHLEAELDKSGFLRPPEKRPAMVRSIRNLFLRAEPTHQEVQTLRGIVASLTRAHLGRRQAS